MKSLNTTQKNIIRIYLILIILGTIYYAIIKFTGHTFPCYIYESTGYYCPGCGLTRSCVNLVNLDFSTAFRNHPLFIISLIFWVPFSIFAFIGKPSGLYSLKNYMIILGTTTVLWLIWGIVRNLPTFEYLTPLNSFLTFLL